jgi:hypothetical protein
MRRAQYSLPRAEGDERDGECAVFYFGPGQGGAIQANVDRWAAQFVSEQGGPVTPQVVETSPGGLRILNVSIEGTYNPSPMAGGSGVPQSGTLLLGAIVEGPDANWFFKCTGPKNTMEGHEKGFGSLVESLRIE